MPSLSLLLVLLNLFFLACLSRGTSLSHYSPPPPYKSKSTIIRPPPPPPSPHNPKRRIIRPPPPPPPLTKGTSPIPPPPFSPPPHNPKRRVIRPPPPPPPKGTSPVLPPPFSQPCKCSVSLKTLGACALVLRGIAVSFAERVCCKGLKKLSYSDVSSCICFVFRSNIGQSSKIRLTVKEAQKVIGVACNL